MGKLKDKHNHALTQWLKVIIFGILLLAPFLSVASRCMYVICNKNGKDSYSDYTIVSERKLTITDYSNLILGQEVMLDTSNVDFSGTYNATGPRLRFSNPSWDGVPQNAYYISFGGVVGRSQNYSISYYATDQSFISYTRITTASTYSFVLYEYITNGAYYINNTFGAEFIEYQFTTEQGTLDNAFEYSVNQLTQTPIFNWVQNTAIYTPVNAMTTGLGFDASNNVLALLLTYWSLLTAVYVVFDIIIACFVKLTHLIQGSD